MASREMHQRNARNDNFNHNHQSSSSDASESLGSFPTPTSFIDTEARRPDNRLPPLSKRDAHNNWKINFSGRGAKNNRGGGQGRPLTHRPGNSPNSCIQNTSPSNPRGYTNPSMMTSQAPNPDRAKADADIQRGSSRSEMYKSWREVTIIINHLPREWVDTWALYKRFSHFGQISYMKVMDRTNYNKYGHSVRVVFSTTPTTPFWDLNVTLPLPGGRQSRPLAFGNPQPPRNQQTSSPIVPNKRFPRNMTIQAGFLFFGLMKSENQMLGMHMIDGTDDATHPVVFDLDMTDRKQKIDIRFSACPDEIPRKLRRYRLQANLQQVQEVLKCHTHDRTYLVISLQDPPKYYKQAEDLEKTHTSRGSEWKEWPRMWERQTDIDNDMDARNNEAISLVRDDPIIDTGEQSVDPSMKHTADISGRWLTYRLDLPANPDTDQRVDDLCTALDHHNIHVNRVQNLELLDRDEGEAWKYLNPHTASHPSDLHQMQDDLVHLDFDVRYQLEACISQRRLNEFDMKLDFFQQLAALDKATALNLLENVADSKQVYHDPVSIFTAAELRARRKRRAPHGCVLMHSVTVTPTTIRINTPTVEVSNRVIRDFSHVEDRFLRVKFEDEDYIGRIFAASIHETQEQVYQRIERALKQGIDIAGRHYNFLAHGNSQFREHGAYFFAPTSDLSTDQIRASLGDFKIINIIAKHAARIGQCFSTTRTIQHLPRSLKQVKIDDEWGIQKGKKYCFTDGVGKVSGFVAQMIADEFRLNCSTGEYPSVYQFRMGGYKGVLAVDPCLKGLTVALRPSQDKFESNTQGLEIIRISSFSTAYLNQQIILVLSALGVSDKTFIDKMINELSRIDKAMTDRQTALDILTKNVDFNQITVSMAEMILDGFMDSKEPFIMSLLQLWRSWRMKFLKEKAHMPVEQGAFVLGCTDETKTLRMVGPDDLPEIFIQVKDADGKYNPHIGLCLIVRNPSLHPGDVRVVKGVACDQLQHLKDVVVMPQQGERDLANMCSGGDLDGDDYLVLWDESLFPPQTSWDSEPMDFTPPPPKMSVNVVTKDQLVENFIGYIKNDRLGIIATRHRAWADYDSDCGGVKSEKCLRLAQLHSTAVDFPKSGVAAEIDEDLMMLPKWPHWAEKKNAPPDRIYHSRAILGQLYDRVVKQQFQPQYNNPFDKRILDAYHASPEMMQGAREMKEEYDADIRRIMAQQGIKTEFEVWTAFVMDHNREKRDYVFAEEMGRLTSMLRSHHRDLVLQRVGMDKMGNRFSNEDFESKLAPFLVAMYTVTGDQVEAAKMAELEEEGDEAGMMPLISYPWLFTAELGRIAMKGASRRQILGKPSIASKAPNLRQYAGSSSPPDISSLMISPLPEAAPPILSGATRESTPDTAIMADLTEAEEALPNSTSLSAASTIVGIPAVVNGSFCPSKPSSKPSSSPDWEDVRSMFMTKTVTADSKARQEQVSSNRQSMTFSITPPEVDVYSSRPPSLASSRSSAVFMDGEKTAEADGNGPKSEAEAEVHVEKGVAEVEESVKGEGEPTSKSGLDLLEDMLSF